ncbi:MAG: hypothetical protein ABIK89_20430 [Planctomycetota bacterium]
MSAEKPDEEHLLSEELWGHDGVTVHGNIRISTSCPCKVEGLTIYGNVEAVDGENVEFEDLWVKKGGNPMAGNVSIRNVGAANVTDNSVAGDVRVDTVGTLNLVRNRVGAGAEQTIDQLILVCEERPTIEHLMLLEKNLDQLKTIAELMEKAVPGTSGGLWRTLKSAAVSLGIDSIKEAAKQGVSMLWKYVQECLQG